jgi:competence protein ComEA
MQIAAWAVATLFLLAAAWKLMERGQGTGAAPVRVERGAGPAGEARLVYVHVAGAVRRPGLYRLRAGARVAFAIQRAGGAARGAQLAGVNLASRVEDGQQIVVPRAGATAGAPAAPGKPGGAKVSLGTATAGQLAALDGIGPTLAKRIVEYRRAHGGFHSIDELNQVEGIGDKRFAALKESVQP